MPSTLPPAEFSLGRWGIPINALAVVYSLWAFFWACWPQQVSFDVQWMNVANILQTPVTAEGFNWASPIFVAVLLVALVYFLIKARHTYEGPVAYIEGRKLA
jgi:choline transport protein